MRLPLGLLLYKNNEIILITLPSFWGCKTYSFILGEMRVCTKDLRVKLCSNLPFRLSKETFKVREHIPYLFHKTNKSGQTSHLKESSYPNIFWLNAI